MLQLLARFLEGSFFVVALLNQSQHGSIALGSGELPHQKRHLKLVDAVNSMTIFSLPLLHSWL